MQTFLPYDDFEKTAQCLDRLRLGKQRVETLQILKALLIPKYGWKNHPVVKCFSFIFINKGEILKNEGHNI